MRTFVLKLTRNIGIGLCVCLLAYVAVSVVISVYATGLGFIQKGAPNQSKIDSFMTLVILPVWLFSMIILLGLMGFVLTRKNYATSTTDVFFIVSSSIFFEHFVSSHYGHALVTSFSKVLILLFYFLVPFFGIYLGRGCLEKDRVLKLNNISDKLQSFKLSKRELEIISELQKGKSNKQIATDLFIEEGTVKKHLKSIFRKTNVQSRLELVSKVMS
jgi:DNA-binding CsgD family transcriptional regulator